ncbi:SDR family NAD(P)-dependent oxidoreductase [Rhodococcoides kyotonense]|uniref:3-oxoacyl-[acyl-carrier-protein] reductase MabA n=1 Tax=Rhodococcoides kyotonense TaxID=398843 RepID=A0A239KDF1_9NOCA|nr:SDR family NAD(P)-dependent oxidoreductase [Rhodococcus kyotonensis]SNT15788.1 NAD(P)-dependent dehydrogenase, short-chain alcohol dehydrogenase family [Rhodococcus kyotonensis]
MDLKLTGKTAFVSGSTQGIGYAIARSLAAEGVAVTINGRDPVKLDKAVASLRGEGATVDGIAADFSDVDQVSRLCDTLADVDILVNNVGLFDLAEFEQISDDEWLRYFEVNVMSGVRLARRIMPSMLHKDWGRIVFVSSESGVNVPGDMIHYGTTKAAMLALANGLAKLTKGTGVNVNSILGGPTYSDGVAQTVESIADAQSISTGDMKAAIIGANPTSLLERFIEPSEIANMVTFLASPAASATNGSAVRVDGGILTTLL